MPRSTDFFRVKVCGVTRVEDALACAKYRVDAIGLNFYPQSPRYVSLERAAEIRRAVPDLLLVGVFVNASLDEILTAKEAADLDYIQLHGDERPDFAAQLVKQKLRVIRAFRCGPGSANKIFEYASDVVSHTAKLSAVLMDAAISGQYGGTGATANWSEAAAVRSRVGHGDNIILAGGLTPENVAAAIEAVRPDAVDTASGVESAPGIKDHAKIRAFRENAIAQLLKF